MTSERDFDNLLRSWLDESAQTPPHTGRALASVLSETAHTRPRSAWLVRLGGEPMPDLSRSALNRMVPLGLAALAAVVVLAIGIGLISRASEKVGNPTPVPIPTQGATPTPGPFGGGLILVYDKTSHPGRFDVLAVDPATGGHTLLGNVPSNDASSLSFQWAQDRKHVLMTDNGGGRTLTLDAPTDAGRQLTFTCCGMPGSLSPTGDRVAAVQTGASGVVDVVVANIDGTGLREFPLPAGADVPGGGVSWSPDQSAVAVAGCLPCNTAEYGELPNAVNHGHVFVVPLDGSPVRQLLDDTHGGFGVPAWSRDGATFLTGKGDCQAGEMVPHCNNDRLMVSIVSVVVADGSERTLLDADQIGGVEQIGQPLVSPDGRRIAFSAWSGDGTDSNVFLMDPDGNNLVQLVAGSFPQWSPDGEWLLFSRPHADQFFDVNTWIIAVNGGEPRYVGAYSGATW
jgi:Tol biopolymer transport system component